MERSQLPQIFDRTSYFSLFLFHSITSSETMFHVRPNFLPRSRKFRGTLSPSEANNPVRSARVKLVLDRSAKMALLVEDRCRQIRSNFRGSLSQNPYRRSLQDVLSLLHFLPTVGGGRELPARASKVVVLPPWPSYLSKDGTNVRIVVSLITDRK